LIDEGIAARRKESCEDEEECEDDSVDGY